MGCSASQLNGEEENTFCSCVFSSQSGSRAPPARWWCWLGPTHTLCLPRSGPRPHPPPPRLSPAARATLASLTAGDHVPPSTLLTALGAPPACDASPYDTRCACGRVAPLCLRGLCPAEGKHKRDGLWALPLKAKADAGPKAVSVRVGRESVACKWGWWWVSGVAVEGAAAEALTFFVDRRSTNTDLPTHPPSQPLDPAAPVGLTNLGATCYVAGGLQCLFADAPFRAAVLAAATPAAVSPPLAALRRLFATLAAPASATAADPTDLVTSLGIEPGEQQDGGEFFKLLLALLESALANDPDPFVSTAVASRFAGRSRVDLACATCGRRSPSSDVVHPFTDVPVPVSGHERLESALAATRAPERLDGADAVACSSCAIRTPAIRADVFLALPPVLVLSLQRFVYDAGRGARVKVASPLSFPIRLPASTLLPSDASTSTPTHSLAAVLIHRGAAATHGHYVAHVRRGAAWWRLDDEGVTPLPGGPASAAAAKDHGVVQAAGAGKAGGRGRGRGRGRGGSGSVSASPRAPPPPPPSTDRVTSANAYMLVYRADGDDAGDAASEAAASALPPDLVAWLADRDKAAAAAIAADATAAAAAGAAADERRAAVRAVVSSRLTQGDGVPADAVWVPSPWLTAWATDAAPSPPADCAALLCAAHGGVDPAKLADAKLLSAAGWAAVRSVSAGGTELHARALCRDCCTALLRSRAAAAAAASARGDAVAVLEVGGGVDREPEGGDCWVSRAFVAAWLTRRGRAPPAASAADGGPTDAILCPHGGLLPDAGPARRAAVPACVWEVMAGDAATAATAATPPKRAKSGGGGGDDDVVVVEDDDENGRASSPPPRPLPPPRELPVLTVGDCDACAAAAAAAAADATDAAAAAAAERALAPSLAAASRPGAVGAGRGVSAGDEVALLPAGWLAAWRAHVSRPPRRSSPGVAGGTPPPPPRPPPLAVALTALVCDCHPGGSGTGPRLAAPPPPLDVTRGRLMLPPPRPGAPWVAVAVEPAAALAAAYGGADVPTARVELVDPQCGPTGGAFLRTRPPVCDAAVAAAAHSAAAAKLVYVDVDVRVESVARGAVEGGGKAGRAPPRVGRAARRGASTLILSSHDTLKEVKLALYEALDVHLSNADVYAPALEGGASALSPSTPLPPGAWRLLAPDAATLGELMVPSDVPLLRVVDAGRVDGEDVSFLDEDGAPRRVARARERGFAGTALAGLPPVAPVAGDGDNGEAVVEMQD